MKRIFISALVCACALGSFAQKKTFDITSYIAPKNWKIQKSDGGIQYSIEDASTGGYCIITLFKSIPGTDSSKVNFDAAWEDLVKGMVTVTAAPEMQEVSSEDGWEAQSGYSPFEADSIKGVAVLATTSGYGKMINIVMLTNTDAYEKDMTAFLESVSFKKPAKINPPQKPVAHQPVTPVKKDGYTYTTTNFDDGWTSTIAGEYVLTTKGAMKVYLTFIEKVKDPNNMRNDFWENTVSRYFITGEKKFETGGALSDFTPDYMEGAATDRQTGEKRYIGMMLHVVAYTGTSSVIIASAPDEQELHRQFPKRFLKYDNDLLPMYRYNKFAVGKNDLAGKWTSGGKGGTMSWYSGTTGDYVGATGVATSDVFEFKGNNTYTSIHNGGYGVVGALNTFQQKYKGNYTVTNWSVTVTDRWDGKTEQYDAWFEIGKGGRRLHLSKIGMSYELYREE